MWAYGCEDSLRTEEECGQQINNPIEIEEYEALKSENDRTCYDAGVEDGKADRPLNKDRIHGCQEFDSIAEGYRGGYQFGCESAENTEESCELIVQGEKNLWPHYTNLQQ
jgi:hypothetical protein